MSVVTSRFPQSRSKAYGLTSAKGVVKIASANARRIKLVVQNRDGAATVEIGGDDLVLGQGIVITAGQTYFDDVAVFTGDVYAVTSAAGPVDVRVRDEWREVQ